MIIVKERFQYYYRAVRGCVQIRKVLKSVITDVSIYTIQNYGNFFMKYYYREHFLGYERVRKEGKTAWGEIHGVDGFENFSSRAFLEDILPKLEFSSPHPTVLECGCGTGPGACFLAERGFCVDGIDIIPQAIEIAREQADERGLDIRYWVQDICMLPHEGEEYDMIVDSYCLQGIVTESDRQCVFAAVRARLRPEGYYLVSTAMYDEPRVSRLACISDDVNGKVYYGYGDNEIIDLKAGIVLRRLGKDSFNEEYAVKIGKTWYLPVRRHRKPAELRAELEAAGFDVLYQGDTTGDNVVCVLRGY
jgi:SAM-dependent methyltransferase